MSSRSYYEMYFHITWHTKSNLRLISPTIEADLYKFIRERIFATPDAIVHAIGGIETHVHVGVSLPPTIQPAEWIGQVKGASSHHINHLHGPKTLHWQNGYGIVTFGEKDLEWVVAYIENQKERHASRGVSDRLERITHPEDAGG